MRFRVEWSHVCVMDVRRMPPEVAARVCRAVLELSGGGPTTAERVRPGDPFSIRVRAPGGGALVYIDVDARALRVWRIYSTRG